MNTYTERAQAAHGTRLNVYVPAPDARIRSWIHPGSAIVGRPGSGLVYYEGNIYDFMDDDFETWLLHAADRLITDYPTVAKLLAPEGQLVKVGTYVYGKRIFRLDDDEGHAALVAWLVEREANATS